MNFITISRVTIAANYSVASPLLKIFKNVVGGSTRLGYLIALLVCATGWSQPTDTNPIQLGTTVQANFGVDADVEADVLSFGQLPGQNYDPFGTDDWFDETFPNPDATHPGSHVINVGDGENEDGVSYSDLRAQLLAGDNIEAEFRMSRDIYSTDPRTKVIWIDAVYFRDQRSNRGNTDATVFDQSINKNFNNPLTWTLKDGSVPGKNDIIDVYGHLRRLPETFSPDDDEFAIVAASTLSDDGTSYVDFEYYRTDITVVANGSNIIVKDPADLADLECGHTTYRFDSDGQVVDHGDIILSFNYTGGGKIADVRLFIWIDRRDFQGVVFNSFDAYNNLQSSSNDLPFFFGDGKGNFPFYYCDNSSANNFGYARISRNPTLERALFAQVNETSTVKSPPWGTISEKNKVVFEYAKENFAELAINASIFGFDTRTTSGECQNPLGSVLVKTRSSDSFTASLKDFAGPFDLGNTPPVSVELDPVTFCEGDSKDLIATLKSTAGNYIVEWFKDEGTTPVKSGNTIDDGPLADLLKYTPTESGTYEVIVTVILGTDPDNTGCFGMASADATVDPNPTPSVGDQSECDGDDATFSTTDVDGETYQWYVSTDDEANYSILTGETGNSLTLSAIDPSMDGNYYKVIATVTATDCTGEDSGKLTVDPNPTPSVGDQSECDGDDATFSTTDVDGETYQWYVSTDDEANYSILTGETGNSLTLSAIDPSMDGNYYKVIATVTATDCTGEDSGKLTVDPNPTPSVGDQSECDGDDATFSTTDVDDETYQWYVSTDDEANYSILTGETGNSLTLSAIDPSMDGNYYKVIATVTATDCTGEDSGKLTVDPNPTPSVGDQSECDGDDATFSTTDVDGETYQWYVSTDDEAIYSILTGETGNSLTLSAIDPSMDGNYYKVIATVTATDCTGEDSGKLTVNPNPTPSVGDQSECDGDDATFSTTDVDGETYQWYVSTDDEANYSILTGETGNSLTLSAIDPSMDGNYYKVIATVTATDCTGEDSGKLTVDPNPTPSVGDQSECDGDDATFSTTDVDGETYQWYVSTDDEANYSILTGETGNSLTLSAIDSSMDGNYYKVIATVTATDCTGEDSGKLTVDPNPTPSVGDQSECDGDDATFSTTDVDGETYQWYVSTDDEANYSILTGETGNSLTLSAIDPSMDGNYYKVIATVTATDCTGEDSGKLTVDPNPTPSVGDQSECDGDDATFSTTDVDGETYQWYVSTDDEANYSILTGETGNSLTLSAIDPSMDGNYYKVIATVTATDCTGEDSGKLTVDPNPTPSVGDQSECDGDDATFSTTDVDGETYQWYVSTDDEANYSILTGETGNSLTLSAIDPSMDGNYYKVIATVTATDCTGEDSGKLTVDPNPTVSPATDTFCDVDQTDKSLNDYDSEVGPGDGYTVSWFSDSARETSASSTGGELPEGDTTFYATVTNDDTGCDANTTLVITIIASPDLDPIQAVAECGSYTLPDLNTISGSSLNDPKYYDNNQANNGQVITDFEITSTQTIWVYDETGTDPNCSDEISFDVTIENCAHIFPTQTDCDEYRCIAEQEDAIDYTLTDICVTVKGPNIRNAVPGVFFYYADLFDVSGSTTTVYLDQTSDLTKYFLAQNDQNVKVWSSQCGAIPVTSVTIYPHGDPNQGDVSLTFNSTPGEDYVISIKYDVKTIIGGKLQGANPTSSFVMKYDDQSGGTVSGSAGGFNLNDGDCVAEPILNPDNCKSVASSSTELVSDSLKSSFAIEEESSFSVAPVPFNEQLSIRYEFDYTSDVKIQFFDLNGSLLRTYADKQVTNGDETQINIDFALKANQVYIMRIETDRDAFSKEVISGN